MGKVIGLGRVRPDGAKVVTLRNQKGMKQEDRSRQKGRYQRSDHELGLTELRRAYAEALLKGCLGREARGLHLTPEQCFDMLKLVLRVSAPSSRDNAVVRDELVAEYSFVLEADGFCTEAAVAQAAKYYDLSRSKVFETRKKWVTKPGTAECRERFKNDPGVRRRTRQFLERIESRKLTPFSGPLF